MIARVLDCGVLLRLYTMFASGLYAWAGITQTETLAFRVAHADSFATATMFGLAAFALLGIIDLIVNDLMPERFVIARALHDRHLVSMAIALSFAVQMFTCVRYHLPNAILPFYAMYVALVPASAFVDVHKRYKKKD